MPRTTPPSRWRLAPTLIVVIVALALGAGSARADTATPHQAAPGGAAATVSG